MSTSPSVPAGPDFPSIAPYDFTERGEFLEGLVNLWVKWAPDDDRWLILRQLTWVIDDQADDTRLNRRLGEALMETVDAVENLHNRPDLDDVTDDHIDNLKASAAVLIEVADDVKDDVPDGVLADGNVGESQRAEAAHLVDLIYRLSRRLQCLTAPGVDLGSLYGGKSAQPGRRRLQLVSKDA